MSTVAAYAAQWGPAAQQAAAQLGIPASWILAQWAVEYGWSNGPTQGTNNPADLAALPGQSASAGGWGNYATVSDFVDSYVATVKSDFGYFSHPIPNPTPAEVFGSQTDYTTSQSSASYTQAVLNAISTAEASGVSTLFGPGAGSHASVPAPGTSVNTPNGVIDNGQVATQTRSAGQDLGAGAKAAAASVAGGVGGWIHGIETWLADAGTIALGVVIAVVGIALLVFAERGSIDQDLAGKVPL